MNVTELERYKREIISEHESEIAAIDRLIARESNKPVASPNGVGPKVVEVSTVKRRRGRPRRQSAAKVVRDAVMLASGRFERNDIANTISLLGSPKQTNRTISIELWKMAQAGDLRTVKEGRGRIPAIYEKTKT